MLVAGTGGGGGGGHTGLGLVTERFMRPGGLASDVSEALLLSGLPLIGTGALVAIFLKSKGCIFCNLFNGETLMGLLLMLLGGDEAFGPLLVVEAVQTNPVGGSFKKLMEGGF